MSNSPTFREIFARIDEAAQAKSQLDEIFGGIGTALKRKAINAINPTSYGAGQRIVDTQAKNVLKAWNQYRGTANIPNSLHALHNWLANILQDNNPGVWTGAVDSFKEKNPKIVNKISKDTEILDNFEILNFLVEYIKARNAEKSETPNDKDKIKKPSEYDYGVEPISQKEYGPMNHPFPE